MRIIGITGKAGAGKDTIADYLCQRYGFVKYSLAQPIKEMLRVIGVDANDRSTKEKPHPIFGVSPRRMAQTLGTEWMRQLIADDGWLRLADKFIQIETQHADFVRQETFSPNVAEGIVIPDIRFDNEARWLREKHNGILWHVIRTGNAAVESHASENGVHPYFISATVYNCGGVERLHRIVDLWAETLNPTNGT